MTYKGYIDEKNNLHFVFPEGYDTESLVDLPEDFNISRGWYRWDGSKIIDDLDSWRLWVRKEANRLAEIELYLPCETTIGTIDGTPKSRQILYNMKFAMLIEPEYTVDFTLNNNSTITCSNSDIDTMLLALRERDDLIHSKYKTIKNTANVSDSIVENIL
jgi:hypothetical protein